MKNLAGMVVLYEPSDNFKDNLNSYIHLLDKLFLVDNSTKSNSKLFEGLINSGKIIYIHQGKNMGIAHALNIGCDEAIKYGYEWILTMDQDSSFIGPSKELILECFQNVPANVALLFPDYLINGNIYNKLFNHNGNSLIAMTSGNILNLQAYINIEKFNEELFIDYVDIDYCLRLNIAGYIIRKVEGVLLRHGLGKTVYKNVFGKKLIITNHNYIRRYYITRNRFFITNKYKEQFPLFVKKEYKLFFNDLLKILLFESEKIKKIRSIIKGGADYAKGQYGEYNIN